MPGLPAPEMTAPTLSTMTATPSSGFTLADLDDAEHDLAAVDRAVQLLEDGRYGVCSVCATSIAAVVAREPLTFECADHRSPAA